MIKIREKSNGAFDYRIIEVIRKKRYFIF